MPQRRELVNSPEIEKKRNFPQKILGHTKVRTNEFTFYIRTYHELYQKLRKSRHDKEKRMASYGYLNRMELVNNTETVKVTETNILIRNEIYVCVRASSTVPFSDVINR